MKSVEKHSKYDCCVVGGGMVGAAMALGLAQQGFRVALIERQALEAYSPTQAPDMRMSAFNMHSFNLLTSLGAWQHVLNMRFRQYCALSVWDAESALAASLDSKVSFCANEVNKEALGFFAENRIVQLALFKEIQANYKGQIDCILEQEILHIDTAAGSVLLDNNHLISATLIFGSDGAKSQVRQAANIACSGWQYSQHANAILIKTVDKLADETWQAFYESGPRALLPMHDNYATLVWYDSKSRSQTIQSADLASLKDAVKQYFPALGTEFEVLQVAGFPLTRMHTNRYGKDKAIILGDAAHTINPLAGQGVNLGYQDVTALLDIIAKQGLHDATGIIKKFEAKRYHQNLLMMSTMDVLYKTFPSDIKALRALRAFGLSAANKAGPIKSMVLKYAMGLY